MKEVIQTDNAPEAIGPYSQAIKAGNLLFISGQIPIDPVTGDLVVTSIEAETKQVLENFKAIVEKANGTLKDVVKTTIFIKNMEQFTTINDIYGQYFTEEPPARACVEVARLPKDVNIEIEGVVLLKG